MELSKRGALASAQLVSFDTSTAFFLAQPEQQQHEKADRNRDDQQAFGCDDQ